jgi:hypothetical protein
MAIKDDKNEIMCTLIKMGISPSDAEKIWVKIMLKQKYEYLMGRIHLWGDTKEDEKPKLRGLRAKMTVYDDAWENKDDKL